MNEWCISRWSYLSMILTNSQWCPCTPRFIEVNSLHGLVLEFILSLLLMRYMLCDPYFSAVAVRVAVTLDVNLEFQF